jgi:crotonobetainyl-CoA:carnitine CoA-transferase CaiB-like acyl-CoA transferase
MSAPFHSCNLCKRSLTIDCKSVEGFKAVNATAADTDIVMHNYKPNLMECLALSSEVLCAINPCLINVAVTGFTDLQDAGDEFSYLATLLCKKITTYTLCQAATAELVTRATTQEGQHIDISMLPTQALCGPEGRMVQ